MSTSIPSRASKAATSTSSADAVKAVDAVDSALDRVLSRDRLELGVPVMLPAGLVERMHDLESRRDLQLNADIALARSGHVVELGDEAHTRLTEDALDIYDELAEAIEESTLDAPHEIA